MGLSRYWHRCKMLQKVVVKSRTVLTKVAVYLMKLYEAMSQRVAGQKTFYVVPLTRK